LNALTNWYQLGAVCLSLGYSCALYFKSTRENFSEYVLKARLYALPIIGLVIVLLNISTFTEYVNDPWIFVVFMGPLANTLHHFVVERVMNAYS